MVPSLSFSIPPSFAYPEHTGAEFYTLGKLLMLKRAAFLGKMVITCMFQFHWHSGHFQHPLSQKTCYPLLAAQFLS